MVVMLRTTKPRANCSMLLRERSVRLSALQKLDEAGQNELDSISR
jgi:hypothetical protein